MTVIPFCIVFNLFSDLWVPSEYSHEIAVVSISQVHYLWRFAVRKISMILLQPYKREKVIGNGLHCLVTGEVGAGHINKDKSFYFPISCFNSILLIQKDVFRHPLSDCTIICKKTFTRGAWRVVPVEIQDDSAELQHETVPITH